MRASSPKFTRRVSPRIREADDPRRCLRRTRCILIIIVLVVDVVIVVDVGAVILVVLADLVIVVVVLVTLAVRRQADAVRSRRREADDR